jgi:hypothetical protein
MARRRERRLVKPTLVELENRIVPTIVYGGGPTIPDVVVNPIVMQQPGVAMPAMNVNAFFPLLVRDYLPLLAPYGIGAGTMGPTETISPVLGKNPTDYQIQLFLLNQIQAGVLPQNGPNQLYFVVLPYGYSVADVGGLGYHSFFPMPNGSLVYYAVADGSGTSQMALDISHELAEAVTDPGPNFGYNGGDPTSEIGDVEGNQTFLLDGYAVQVVSGPQGQPIAGPTSGPLVPADLLHLAVLAYEYGIADTLEWAATYDSALLPLAAQWDLNLASNPLYGTQVGIQAEDMGTVLANQWTNGLDMKPFPQVDRTV